MRAELLSAVKALKSHVTDPDKYAVGLSWEKVERVQKNIRVNTQNNESDLSKICTDMADCQLCSLGKTRRNLVFGDGNPQAKVVFVGEAPGSR